MNTLSDVNEKIGSSAAKQEEISSEESQSDSSEMMFGNLAPVSKAKSSSYLEAKRRRLLGESQFYSGRQKLNQKVSHPKTQNARPTKVKIEEKQESRKEERSRSREKKPELVNDTHKKADSQSFQNEKQNDSGASNQLKNVNNLSGKFSDLQKHLYLPIDQLKAQVQKTEETIREEKLQKRRLDRLIEKKSKEYKVGKTKDQTSNSVFNGIEDYFN